MFKKVFCLFFLAFLHPHVGYAQAADSSYQQSKWDQYERIFQLSETNDTWVKFDGNFLYWRPYSEGMDYAFTYIEKNNLAVADLYEDELEVKDVHLGWDPGYRFRAAVFLPEINFDTSISWTHFSSYGSNQIDEQFIQNAGRGAQARRVERIWLFEQIGTSNTIVETLKGDLKIKLSYLDWELGKSFSFPDYLILRPFAGFRNVWLNQDFVVSSTDSVPTIPAPIISTMDMSNNFWGIGPIAGLNGKWRFFDFFAFRFSGSASLLFGKFKIRQDEDIIYVNAGSGGSFPASTRFKKRAVKPSFQLGAGMEFGYTFTNAMRWEILLDYELNLFLNQNQLIRFYLPEGPLHTPGDVSMHGFTLGSALYF